MMHIVGNLLSLSLSQISSQSLHGQHSQQWCQREQQQCQPASTTNTSASFDNASSDVADHAIDYGQYAARSRASASTITPAP
jgi:hypothetical protein